MKKPTFFTYLLAACLALTSCTDSGIPDQTAVMRDYQTDARILSRFVDVNKALGEYFINENKKTSPLAYITDTDWQELQAVNPVNRTRFENDLNALNSQLAAVAGRPDVSQIIFNTYDEAYIKKTGRGDIPFRVGKANPSERTSTRSSYGSLDLLYSSPQRQSFYAGNSINTRISINLSGYTYYFFEVICNTNATRSGSNAGESNPKSIVMSGIASVKSRDYRWTENTGRTNVYWDFKGKRNAPQGSGQISVEFYD